MSGSASELWPHSQPGALSSLMAGYGRTVRGMAPLPGKLGFKGIYARDSNTDPFSPPSLLQLRNLITDSSHHKLLIFAGPCVEETGELVLQTGTFALRDFIQVFADKAVSRLSPPPPRPMPCLLPGGSVCLFWEPERCSLI